jgi:hypothetical protein
VTSCALDLGSEPLAESELGEARLAAETAPRLDIRRSLVVTDPRILESFSFRRVMEQLITQARTDQTAVELYRQWWDLQNDRDNRQISSSDSCATKLNQFPLECPRQEGLLAANNRPFGTAADQYATLALFNRFDLADGNRHCGEYRIVFGKRPVLEKDQRNVDRNLIIFEARLPNPNPSQGLDGCAPIVQFWASLSQIQSPTERTRLLENFYFNGLEIEGRDRRAVIDIRNYQANTGQIRSNQFMFGRQYFDGKARNQPWQLREFKLAFKGRGDDRRLVFKQVTVKDNAFGDLFDDESKHAHAAEFRTYFLTQVEKLARADSVNAIAYPVLNQFNPGQSSAMGDENNYPTHFKSDGAFARKIAAKIPSGSKLTALHIVRRAMANSCGGCHQLNNPKTFQGQNNPNSDLGGGITWPSSLNFVQVSDLETVACEGSQRCAKLSPALEDDFLPARKANMETFLKNLADNRRNEPILNRRVH